MPSVETESTGGLLFYRGEIAGRAVVVARSGMGRVRTLQTVGQMLGRYSPRTLLICGFAGGLSETQAPGDIVVTGSLRDAAPLDTRPTAQPDPALVAKTETVHVAGVTCRICGLLTYPSIAQSARHKREIATLYPGSLAMDMETAGAAGVAAEAGTPWIGIRAISDGINDDLPLDFSGMINDETGEVSVGRIVLAALLHPWKIPDLARLGGRAGLAARNLASFVESYVIAIE